MTKKTAVKEVSPTPKEILENRLKRVEIIDKVEIAKQRRKKEEVELKIKEVDLEKKKANGDGWNHPISVLLSVAQAWKIDNDASVGTEPALRSLWDEEALNFIRKKLIKKIKEL